MAVLIEAVFFDVNGTLRTTAPAGDHRKSEKIQRMLDLLGEDTTVEQFFALVQGRLAAYRLWARETRRELPEAEVWLRWLLPDRPAARIQGIAPQLHQLWREATGVRTILPDAPGVIHELFRRGYRLGLISNTLGERELVSALRDLGIRGLFDTIVLSSHIGCRKPDPRIMAEAARRLSIEPAKCAYVGNRLDRDVAPARAAGFGSVVLLRGPQLREPVPPMPDGPDHLIDSLLELLDIFPGARSSYPAAYQASISTMWIRHNLTGVRDILDASPRLGFAAIELNHQIDSAMLAGIELERQPISSVHEPCPADVSTDKLKERDWLMSSPDEACRRRGVEAIRHSIEIAGRLNVPIVVHCGMVSTDLHLEQQLKVLLEGGRQSGAKYRAVQSELIETRRKLVGPRLDAVERSLCELLSCAAQFGVRLGLENRYHYFDIPGLDEMGRLLALAGPEQLGFVYDVGHAQALDRLGFYAHEEWLRRYSARIIEVHLHDVRGTTDHMAPGLGEVDFRMVASYLPAHALRTLELLGTNTPEQVRAGLRHLARCGCIRLL